MRVEESGSILKVFDEGKTEPVAQLTCYSLWNYVWGTIDVEIAGQTYRVDRKQYLKFIKSYTGTEVTESNILKYVNFEKLKPNAIPNVFQKMNMPTPVVESAKRLNHFVEEKNATGAEKEAKFLWGKISWKLDPERREIFANEFSLHPEEKEKLIAFYNTVRDLKMASEPDRLSKLFEKVHAPKAVIESTKRFLQNRNENRMDEAAKEAKFIKETMSWRLDPDYLEAMAETDHSLTLPEREELAAFYKSILDLQREEEPLPTLDADSVRQVLQKVAFSLPNVEVAARILNQKNKNREQPLDEVMPFWDKIVWRLSPDRIGVLANAYDLTPDEEQELIAFYKTIQEQKNCKAQHPTPFSVSKLLQKVHASGAVVESGKRFMKYVDMDKSKAAQEINLLEEEVIQRLDPDRMETVARACLLTPSEKEGLMVFYKLLLNTKQAQGMKWKPFEEPEPKINRLLRDLSSLNVSKSYKDSAKYIESAKRFLQFQEENNEKGLSKEAEFLCDNTPGSLHPDYMENAPFLRGADKGQLATFYEAILAVQNAKESESEPDSVLSILEELQKMGYSHVSEKVVNSTGQLINLLNENDMEEATEKLEDLWYRIRNCGFHPSVIELAFLVQSEQNLLIEFYETVRSAHSHGLYSSELARRVGPPKEVDEGEEFEL